MGHTILPALALHESHFFLDRGAYRNVIGGERAFGLALLDTRKTLEWLDINVPGRPGQSQLPKTMERQTG